MKNTTKYVCPHCNRSIGGIANFKRFHNDNCKSNYNLSIVIENNSVKIEDSKSKIVFDKQLNWLNILKEIASTKEIKTNELEKIDLSDAMYGAPAPYTLPSKKN
jgi:hypothetical protein